MLNFRLQVFRSVAKNLSFTKAANELHISQPAVSKHIKELELEYNLRLFDRKGNRIFLTNPGKTLLNHSEKILTLHQDLEYEMSKFGKHLSGQLRLGASTTMSQYVLPPVLADFYNRYSGLRLSMRSANSTRIADYLLNGIIDLGIVEGRLKNRSIRYEQFMEDTIVPVVHQNSQFAQYNEISLDQLLSIPLVLREPGSGTLQVIEHALRAKNIRLSDLNRIMYMGSTESIKTFMESTDIMSFISLRAIQKELKYGLFKVINIKALEINRTFNFITLQGNPPSGLARQFMNFAKLAAT
ncbi:MAG: LysR substrate-binding domain-containing protein [Chitinophagales bacterium]